MNISTFSPALALLYVFALLWILMGVDAKSFSRKQRWIVPLAAVVLCAANHLLRNLRHDLSAIDPDFVAVGHGYCLRLK